MSYTPGYVEPVPPMVSVHTLRWGPPHETAVTGEPGSATWESANRAVYYPLYVPTTCVARRVWWANGATTSGGATVEVGIYRSSGALPSAKLVSGSATQGTASQVQFVDITDTTLTPGQWWLAITMSSTTNTTGFRHALPGEQDDAIWRFEEASANPLPATATPVETTNSIPHLWIFGFSTTTIT